MAEAPVYNSVPTSENDDKPPSYFNVISQIKVAKNDAKSPTELGQRVLQILANSFIFTIIMAISSILPVAMLVIGILSQEKCTLQPKIPLWLMVTGAGGIATAALKFIGNMIVCAKSRKREGNSEPKLLSCFSGLLSVFLFIWFIIGNYWVYSIYSKVQYEQIIDPENYCDKLCYLFSFWSITASWILLGMTCCCLCGTICIVVGVSMKVLSKS